MQKSFFSMLIVSALATFGVSIAQANLTVHSIDYELYSEVDADNNSGISTFDSDESFGSDSGLPSSFDDFVNTSVVLAGAEGTAGGHLYASVYDTFSPLSVELDMGAAADTSASVTNGYAYGYALSSFIIEFSTEIDYLFRFSTEFISAEGNAVAEAVLLDSLGNELFNVTVEDGFESPFISVVGGADDYIFSVVLESEANADFNNNITADSSSTSGLMFFEASPVPVPAALPLMLSALSIFGVMRLRRS